MNALFRLDGLPAGAGIETQILDSQGPQIRVRFRANKPGRGLAGLVRKKRYSEWSGWFDYDGEMIDLKWAAFWEDR